MTRYPRGNALFLILIAVALFAALAYAVTQSGRGGGNADTEKARLLATQMIDFGNSVRNGVQRITTIGGTGIEAIDFAQGATGDDGLFSPTGGGVKWVDAPAAAFADGISTTWIFEKPSYGWSSANVGTAAAEGFIWAQGAGISDAVCKAVNQLMGKPGTIPVDADGGPLMEPYPGEAATVFCYKEGAQPAEFIYVFWEQ